MTTPFDEPRSAASMPEERWPEEGLEYLGRCPVCGDGSRTLLYAGLTDRVFRAAPGRWTMYRCRACRSAYLDPRPTVETIGRAYLGYDRETNAASDPLQSTVTALARRLMFGHLNSSFGYHFAPRLWAGGYLMPLLPGIRGMAERYVRSLPLTIPQPRLLDLGCGKGDFLALMRDAGWLVEGIEPDRTAAKEARARGLHVREGVLDVGNAQPERFDAITLSHVVEHLHDPTGTLRACHSALKPGGVIWIATPNIEAQGHRSFGRDWVGLDPPRHLAVFTDNSLRRTLVRVGFERPSRPRFVPQAVTFTYRASAAIRSGAARPYRDPPIAPRSTALRALLADIKAMIRARSAEELVVLARRPAR